jgi:hypothetical protein
MACRQLVIPVIARMSLDDLLHPVPSAQSHGLDPLPRLMEPLLET